MACVCSNKKAFIFHNLLNCVSVFIGTVQFLTRQLYQSQIDKTQEILNADYAMKEMNMYTEGMN